MKPIEEEAFSALLCEACGAVYYPEKEFNRHLGLVRTRPVADLLAAGFAERSDQEIAADGEVGPCPGCGTPMQWRPLGSDSNLMLVCPACGGLWARPGQIERVALSLKGERSLDQLPDDVLDRYAEGLLDEQRQRDEIEQLERSGELRASFWALPFFTGMPVSDADELRRLSFATWALVFLNVVLFILSRIFGSMLRDMAMVPAEITRGTRLFTLITYQFAHDGVLHLFLNMWVLRAFGDRVEDQLGQWRFVASYVALGIVAGLAYAYMYPDSTTPCVGASGAISGILGLYGVLFPTRMLRVVVIWTTVRVPTWFYVALWLAIQVLAGSRGGVAVEAHLGGFFTGMWLGGAVRVLRLGKAGAGRRTRKSKSS
jgi:membrane associated rhomboid family serine protease